VLYVGERLRRRAHQASNTGPAARHDPDATVVMAAIGQRANGDRANATADTVVFAPVGPGGPTAAQDADAAADDRLARISFGRGTLIGSAQILPLLPGVSRSGITMVAGLLRGLSNEDAARFPSCWLPRSSWPPGC
jgi:hypothetical protein